MHRHVLIDCLPWLGAILFSVVLARVLVGLSGARWQWDHALQLHRDERGAVQSLSFVLTLPIFVMLMLFIVQLSQLTIARLAVEYAAYAAVRSAIVWIPADMGDMDEPPNCIGIRSRVGTTRDERGVDFDVYRITQPSRKMDKIELAAAMALMPVCPSRHVYTGASHPGLAAAGAIEKAYQAIGGNSRRNTAIPTRLRNKLGYALENTSVEIEVRHRQDEPALDWPQPQDIPPYRDEFRPNEIGWQDQVLVKVTHDFALLPGPGRFLAKRLIAPGRTSDEVADRIQQRGNVFVYPLTAVVRLSNEGEKPVLPYVQKAAWQLPSSSIP